MVFEGLVAELKRLIRDRIPGSQAKESVESFGQAKFLLELRFFSSSRTFGSKIGKEYEGGQTIVCSLKGHDLQVAVMMLSSSNDWVKERTKEDGFELWGRLVSYDTLYDRAIFGQALEGDSQEQPFSDPESIYEEPKAVLPKEAIPVQPQEVIRRSVQRTKRIKLPKKAKTRMASERKLYKKSSNVAAPGRDKRLFWGKPRKLKIIKRSGSNPKRVGHEAPSRKPLKRSLKSAPKANQRWRLESSSVGPVKFRVSNQASLLRPVHPADIVRILQKKKSLRNLPLTPQEQQTLENYGLNGLESEGFKDSKGCRRGIAISLVVLSIPCCTFSSGSTFFGCLCLIVALSCVLPDFIKEFHSQED
jgi:hypothetical protein